MKLNYDGVDLTGEGLEGFVGSFPCVTRDGVRERELEVIDVDFDGTRSVVHLREVRR